tara:strand:- start:39 stop:278 length:240 start_codon:yes stop_codon:yes gene_type:complete
MSSYSQETPTESSAPLTKKPRTNGRKMTDKQKADLSKHMVKMKDGGMTLTEQRSHRMKLMGKMRKGESLNKAHKSITSD